MINVLNIINDIYSLYNSLYKGELLEKFKRFFLIKTRLIERVYKLPKDFLYEYINYFNINENKIKNISITDSEKTILMNRKIDLNEIKFNTDKHQKKWYYTKILKDTDIKFLWEINRLQFLPLMALNYVKSRDRNKLKKIINILKLWEKQNPYDYGINWYSNLEIAIRSISILLTYILICDDYKSKDIEKLLFQHGYHIYKDIFYTEKCIPNNHVIGEATALYILGNVVRSKYSNKWIKKAKKILEKYLHYFRQDGTYLEASLSYHRFTLQMYLLVYLFSKKFNDNFIVNKLEKTFSNSYYFLKTIEKPDDTYPQFGDWDDGVFYKLDFEKITNYKSFVDTIGYFLGLTSPTIQSTVLESIFGKINIKKEISNKKSALFLFKEFKEGKYVAIKDENNYLFMNNQDQIFHSHADGLSLEISINGKNITLDSGTYLYNINKKLRRYFRSTKAHNTVYLGYDHSKQVGTFRWINQPKTTLKVFEKNKYYTMKGNLITYKKELIERTVMYNKNSSDIIIIDRIKSKDYEINWHFSTQIRIKKINDLKYSLNNGLYILIYSKEEIKELLGKSYYSPSYNVLTKRDNLKIKKHNEKEENIIITVFTNDGNFNFSNIYEWEELN